MRKIIIACKCKKYKNFWFQLRFAHCQCPFGLKRAIYILPLKNAMYNRSSTPKKWNCVLSSNVVCTIILHTPHSSYALTDTITSHNHINQKQKQKNLHLKRFDNRPLNLTRGGRNHPWKSGRDDLPPPSSQGNGRSPMGVSVWSPLNIDTETHLLV